jgi:hypothetical protein
VQYNVQKTLKLIEIILNRGKGVEDEGE